MKYDIIAIGGATYDITLFPAASETFLFDDKNDATRQKFLAFEYGAKIKLDKTFYSFGGGAANAAVSISRLGLKSAAIAAIGNDDFGKKILSNFKKQGVEAGLVQVKANKRTGLSVIIVGPDSDHTVFSDRDANDELKLSDRDSGIFKNAGWVYITSLGGEWQNALDKVFSATGKTKVAWNPGQKQLTAGMAKLKKYLLKTKVLILNLDEAIQLVISDSKYSNKKTGFLNNAKNLLPVIKKTGPEIAVITCGKDGAWACDGQKFYYTKIQKEQKRVDTTGVGDSFGSAFIAGLELFKGDIARSMKLGIANAASVIAVPGAQNGLLSKRDLVKIKL